MTYDILIKNGRVIDPASGIDEIKTVGVIGNKIVEVDADAVSVNEVDASGCIVTPGLIDYHTHVFWGASEYSVKPETCLPFGVTTLVDAGTAGAANFDVFYQNTIVNSIPRVASYLSVNSGGLFGREWHTHYDPSLLTPGQLSYKNIKAMFEKYPDTLQGLKLMLSTGNVGDKGIEILEATIKLAEEIGCRVCVHTTNMSVPHAEVAKRLRKGDVYCHCFTYTEGRSILDEDGKVNAEVLAARERGVIFDAANGSSHYDHEVVEKAFAQGFYPDIISTDIVIYLANAGHKVRNLPFLMSKYLCMGISLPEVINKTTAVPAEVMGLSGKIGTLAPGAFADIAIFKIKETEVGFEGTRGDYRYGKELLIPQMTIQNGDIVYAQVDFNY